MRNIYLSIPLLAREEGRLVLATVISTRGSTPQKAGSSALFSSRGLLSGTIGGGVLEGKVLRIACESAVTGHSGIHHFELDRDISHSEEAICGGQATVLIDPGVKDHLDLFRELEDLVRKRISCTLTTEYLPGKKGRPSISRILSKASGNEEKKDFILAVNDSEGDQSKGFRLLESIHPSPRLVIAGAGHIGKSLSHLGSLLDFEVTVIDDRKEFASRENLPDADHIIADDIEHAMTGIEKNFDTFIVIVTRGHNDDAGALRPCIGSDAAYIGMIGSRTKIEKMHRSFIEKGWATEKQWSEIHAPVGIDINSKSVEEIAVSIAAQLVKVRNRNK